MLDHLFDSLCNHLVLPCIGPQVRTSAGLPCLRTVARQLADELSDAARDEVLALLPQPSRVFSLLDRILGPACLHQRTRPLLDRPDAKTPAIASALTRLSPALNYVLTTNADRVLDRAFAGNWPGVCPTEFQQGQHGLILYACGAPHTGPRLTHEELFGPPAMLRHEALARHLASHQVILIGYEPDDEALRYLDTACRGVLRGVVLVPARRPGYPAQLEVIEVGEPFDERAAAQLQKLAEAYGRHARITLPTSGDDVPVTSKVERPFPGLEPYTNANHRFFCGRELELDDLLLRLGQVRGSTWCQIVGPSGVGKSSFVRAGLGPRFVAGDPFGEGLRWIVVEMRPGYDPLRALADALLAALPNPMQRTADALAKKIGVDPHILPSLVEQHLGAKEALLLLVDPLDEAITLSPPDTAASFSLALDILAARASRRVLLVTTLRSDLIEAMPRLPALDRRATQPGPELHCAQYELHALRRDQLSISLRRSARRGGLEFEKNLIDLLLKDADRADSVHVLPNVAAALDRLWARRKDPGLLTLAAYTGVEHALTEAVDEVIRPLLETYGESVLRTLFLSLVAVNPEGRAIRRQLRREDLRARLKTDKAEELLAAISGRDPQHARSHLRLVSVAQEWVELVHDALVRGWLRLVRWIDAYHDELIQTESLHQAAKRWQFFGEPDDIVANPSEASYLLKADPIDAISRTYQAELQNALEVADERRRELEQALKDLRDDILPRLDSDRTRRAALSDATKAVATALGNLPNHSRVTYDVAELQKLVGDARHELATRGAREAHSASRTAYERAETLLRRALGSREVELLLIDALTILGEAEFQLGLISDACHHFRRAKRLSDSGRAGFVGHAAAQQLSGHLRLLVLLADAETRRGGLTEASELLRKAHDEITAHAMTPPDLRAAGSRPRVPPRLCALIMTRLAQLALRSDELVHARELLAAARRWAPDASFVLDCLATVEIRSGNLAAARPHLSSCVEAARSPLHGLAEPGERVTARVDIPRCRELALHLARLGELSLQLGDLAGAAGELDEAHDLAAAIHARDPSLRSKRDLSRCVDRLGNLALARGDRDLAKARFKTALQLDLECLDLDGRTPQSRLAVAVAYRRCGEALLPDEPEAARKFFHQAREQCSLCPSEPQVLRELAAIDRLLKPPGSP